MAEESPTEDYFMGVSKQISVKSHQFCYFSLSQIDKKGLKSRQLEKIQFGKTTCIRKIDLSVPVLHRVEFKK